MVLISGSLDLGAPSHFHEKIDPLSPTCGSKIVMMEHSGSRKPYEIFYLTFNISILDSTGKFLSCSYSGNFYKNESTSDYSKKPSSMKTTLRKNLTAGAIIE